MLEFRSNPLPASRASYRTEFTFSILASWLSLTSTISLVASYCIETTHWIQPTIIGLIWSNWFFAGLILGTWRNGTKLLFVALVAILGNATFARLTDFSLLEGTLLCVPGLAFGRFFGRQMLVKFQELSELSSTSAQCSILDLFMLTSGIAIFVGGMRSYSISWEVMIVVALTFACGLIISWSALQVAFRDVFHPTLISLQDLWISRIYFGFCFSLLVSLCFHVEFMAILWRGPVPVVAAQGCFVLFGASLIRMSAGNATSVFDS